MSRDLLPADRCDACGSSQAFFLAEKAGTSELIFCRHHGLEHLDALVMDGWTIDNQCHKLDVTLAKAEA